MQIDNGEVTVYDLGATVFNGVLAVLKDVLIKVGWSVMVDKPGHSVPATQIGTTLIWELQDTNDLCIAAASHTLPVS